MAVTGIQHFQKDRIEVLRQSVNYRFSETAQLIDK